MTSIVVRSELWRGGQLPPSQRRSTDSSRILPDPSHEVQTNGGLADDWYLDDGDVLCDARLVNAYLTCFDRCNPSVGGERNITKTEVIYYVDEQALQSHAVDWQLAAVDWQLAAVRATATVRTAEQPGLTLGVVTGSIEDIEAQLCQKSDVVRAIQERVGLVQDVQTEQVLNRDCLGVGRVNHILRVHGDAIARVGTSLHAFDAAMEWELDRLIPGLTEESHVQSALGIKIGGLGWRHASQIARPANLGALIMAEQKVKNVATAAVQAGLLRAGQVEGLLDAKIASVESAFLGSLDEAERVKAMDFLREAREASAEHLESPLKWRAVIASGPTSTRRGR